MCFPELRLVIVDENWHTSRNDEEENERQRKIETELSCIFYRINPDKKGFNIFVAISEIWQLIKEIKKKTIKQKNKRKRRQNKRTRRWNKKNESSINKSKCLKWIAKYFVEKILPSM